MTPQEILASLQTFTPQQLAGMNHASLYMARQGATPEQQKVLSPYEHQAFAREATAENPLMALPIAAGTLAYQPYKMIMGQARSAPSMDQVTQGLKGVGQGLWQAFQQMVEPSRPNLQADTDTRTSATGLLGSLQNYQPRSNIASTSHQQPTSFR
jgi:hypothetical protein